MEQFIDSLLLKHKNLIINTTLAFQIAKEVIFYETLDINELFVYSISLGYISISIQNRYIPLEDIAEVINAPAYTELYTVGELIIINMSISEKTFSEIFPSTLPQLTYQKIYQTIFEEIVKSIKNGNVSGIISEYVLLRNDFS